MLAPGMTFDGAGSVRITAGAATTPAFFNEGVGFMADGSLAVDTDAPAGNIYDGGIRLNAAGAMYGTTGLALTDVFNRSVKCSILGQLVYEVFAPSRYNNGNPVTNTGALATN